MLMIQAGEIDRRMTDVSQSYDMEQFSDSIAIPNKGDPNHRSTLPTPLAVAHIQRRKY
jgi:hypothetical protein